MTAQLCVLFACSLFISFLSGIVYHHYSNDQYIPQCECHTDDNIIKYQQWLDQYYYHSTDSSPVTPRLLSTAHEVTPTTKDTTSIDETSSILTHYDPFPTTLHWTSLKPTGTTVFSAYYYNDRRLVQLPAVLVLGYQSKLHRNSTLYCYYMYKDGSTECSVRRTVVLEMDSCDKQKEFVKKNEREYLHVFHTCLLTGDEIPLYVALSSDSVCHHTTKFIPVHQKQTQTKLEFGVCIETPVFNKGLADIVSFIEIYKLLGAQMFTMYSLSLEPSVIANLKKIYPNNVLQIIEWTTNLHEKEPIHYYGEILAIHDCLYRNMHRVKYLAFVDLDEILVPRRFNTWSGLIHEVDRPYIDSFIFMNTIFMRTQHLRPDIVTTLATISQCEANTIPQYFTHFDRVKCIYHYNSRAKMIIKPDHIFDISIHTVCTRLSNTTHYYMPSSSALSHHYRTKPTIECRKNRRTRKYDSAYDDWMLKYVPAVYDRTNKAICSNDLLRSSHGNTT